MLFYSLSHKTVNAKENFWNVYCFATNQTRDETAKDDRQTAAGISHDLIRNNELAVFLLQEIFNIPFGSPNRLDLSLYRIDLKVSANCENLQRYRSAS